MFIKQVMNTFQYNGQEVVLVVYRHNGMDVDLYAVPVEVADKLKIDDFNEEEDWRTVDSLLDEISQYRMEKGGYGKEKLSYVSILNTD